MQDDEEAVGLSRMRPRMDTALLRRQIEDARIRQQPPPKEPEKVAQPPRFDPIFKNMDTVIKDMYSYVPNVSSELVYRTELDKDMKIYGFFMFFGLICILTAVAYSLF